MFQKVLVSLAGLASINGFAQSTVEPSSKNSSAPTSSSQTAFNPDIGVNFLTLYRAQKREGAKKTEPDGGFLLQEAEFQFSANVDAYFRAVALFAVHPTHNHDDHAHILADDHAHEEGDDHDVLEDDEGPEERGYDVEPEEVYLETIAIPYVTLKLGRFHANLGRHNQLHTHAYPFVDAPLISQRLFGDHGLIENGISAAGLIPLPWFMEVSAQALQGDSPEIFASESSSDVATVYRLRNLFDLNDDLTLDFGLSQAHGHNHWNGKTKVSGADFSLKWRPTMGGKYQAFALSGEYLQGDIGKRTLDEKLSGYSVWAQYQASQRVWLQVRTDEAKSEDEGAKTHRKLSALIGFNPTEFSGLRLQVDQLHDDEEKPLNSVLIQGNITIGAHPAHTY